MLKEIRIHGRGGQGVVTAAELMAQAAFEDGKYSQAFPFFGSERMGSPLASFVRINDKKIKIKTQIYNPDYVIVQDPTLLGVVDVLAGIKENGLILINHEKSAQELNLNTKVKIRTIPATKIALEILGKPIPNTILLGAFAGISEEISLEGVKSSIKERFSSEIAQKNIQAVERAYQLMKGES
ncbi:MAG: pyruvate ferredoxin oxidoreductase subunit gamma [Armatimonadetes bacterium]|nr:pyruvate ferredoxin oxidoreductase subunit gamma [Armatimonadota bacterium]